MRKLRALRKAAGLTLPELGKKTGLSGSAIGNFETGRTEMADESLKRISDFFGESIEILREFEGQDSVHRSSVEWRTDRMYGQLPEEYTEQYKPQTSPGVRAMSREEIFDLIEPALKNIKGMESGPKMTHLCHYVMDFLFELSNRRETKRKL